LNTNLLWFLEFAEQSRHQIYIHKFSKLRAEDVIQKES